MGCWAWQYIYTESRIYDGLPCTLNIIKPVNFTLLQPKSILAVPVSACFLLQHKSLKIAQAVY